MKGPFAPLPRLARPGTYTATAILQRVLSASVTVDKEVVSSIGKGVLVLAAVAAGDTEKEVNTIANKVLRLKLWDDDGSPVRSNRRIEAALLRVPEANIPV